MSCGVLIYFEYHFVVCEWVCVGGVSVCEWVKSIKWESVMSELTVELTRASSGLCRLLPASWWHDLLIAFWLYVWTPRKVAIKWAWAFEQYEGSSLRPTEWPGTCWDPAVDVHLSDGKSKFSGIRGSQRSLLPPCQISSTCLDRWHRRWWWFFFFSEHFFQWEMLKKSYIW